MTGSSEVGMFESCTPWEGLKQKKYEIYRDSTISMIIIIRIQERVRYMSYSTKRTIDIISDTSPLWSIQTKTTMSEGIRIPGKAQRPLAVLADLTQHQLSIYLPPPMKVRFSPFHRHSPLQEPRKFSCLQ